MATLVDGKCRTDHPLYRTWRDMLRDAKTKGDIDPQWRESFAAFVHDVGEKPVRDEGRPIILGRLDFLKSWSKDNVHWFHRSMYDMHAKKEKHRLLMQEIRQPVPPHVPPTKFFRVTCAPVLRPDPQTSEQHYRRMTETAHKHGNPATTAANSLYRFEYKGKLCSITELSKLSGLTASVLRRRLKKGMSVTEAVETPHAP